MEVQVGPRRCAGGGLVPSRVVLCNGGSNGQFPYGTATAYITELLQLQQQQPELAGEGEGQGNAKVTERGMRLRESLPFILAT